MSCDIMSGCDFVSLVGYMLCVMSCQSLTEQSCLLDSAMFNFFCSVRVWVDLELG